MIHAERPLLRKWRYRLLPVGYGVRQSTIRNRRLSSYRETIPCLRLSITYAPVAATPTMKTMDTKYVLAGFVEENIDGP